jgi:hypothetical protein
MLRLFSYNINSFDNLKTKVYKTKRGAFASFKQETALELLNSETNPDIYIANKAFITCTEVDFIKISKEYGEKLDKPVCIKKKKNILYLYYKNIHDVKKKFYKENRIKEKKKNNFQNKRNNKLFNVINLIEEIIHQLKNKVLIKKFENIFKRKRKEKKKTKRIAKYILKDEDSKMEEKKIKINPEEIELDFNNLNDNPSPKIIEKNKVKKKKLIYMEEKEEEEEDKKESKDILSNKNVDNVERIQFSNSNENYNKEKKSHENLATKNLYSIYNSKIATANEPITNLEANLINQTSNLEILKDSETTDKKKKKNNNIFYFKKQNNKEIKKIIKKKNLETEEVEKDKKKNLIKKRKKEKNSPPRSKVSLISKSEKGFEIKKSSIKKKKIKNLVQTKITKNLKIENQVSNELEEKIFKKVNENQSSPSIDGEKL